MGLATRNPVTESSRCAEKRRRRLGLVGERPVEGEAALALIEPRELIGSKSGDRYAEGVESFECRADVQN